ncbi:class C sortase [Olsenella porci]|uniref:Class C sortase n=1 Tax=Olsenella porci TaxID=2652279 RepID=A0A6N7XN51_9ACTN|nr:class C sortase [Olsenella porci]MST72374.1 class C sortase [Olsenella porci]
MNKKLRILLQALGMLVGIALIAYPYVSDYLQKQYQEGVIVTQESATDGSDPKVDLDAERRRALEYNQQLADGRVEVTDPFDPNASRPTDEEYLSLMDVAGDGVMGTLVIPKVSLKIPVYHTVEDDVLQRGAGHMPTTSLPYGGPSSHAVIAGHNGLPSVRIFDDLTQLQVGDYFVLQVLGEDHAYRVTSLETVLPNQTESLRIRDGKDLVTLVTCTPYGINTHRLLVHAERCELPRGWTEGTDSHVSTTPPVRRTLLPLTLLGLAIAMGVLLGLAMRHHERRRGDGRAGGSGDGAPGGGVRAGTGYYTPGNPYAPKARGAGERSARSEVGSGPVGDGSRHAAGGRKHRHPGRHLG